VRGLLADAAGGDSALRRHTTATHWGERPELVNKELWARASCPRLFKGIIPFNLDLHQVPAIRAILIASTRGFGRLKQLGKVKLLLSLAPGSHFARAIEQ
jgi:hypothetical protein